MGKPIMKEPFSWYIRLCASTLTAEEAGAGKGATAGKMERAEL